MTSLLKKKKNIFSFFFYIPIIPTLLFLKSILPFFTPHLSIGSHPLLQHLNSTRIHRLCIFSFTTPPLPTLKKKCIWLISLYFSLKNLNFLSIRKYFHSADFLIKNVYTSHTPQNKLLVYCPMYSYPILIFLCKLTCLPPFYIFPKKHKRLTATN